MNKRYFRGEVIVSWPETIAIVTIFRVLAESIEDATDQFWVTNDYEVSDVLRVWEE